MSPHVCRVLEEDPELAEAVPAEERAEATRRCLARVLTVHPGAWPDVPTGHGGQDIGLLVLEGLLIRRVGIDGRFGAELLGPGDLLRPWEWEDEPPTLPVTSGWRVLEPSRLAVLDERFTACLRHHPQLVARLIARSVGRSRHLAVNMAIVHQPRVDVRLHMLLWHLAGRWGVVGPEGVALRLRITHALLAELTAARRPTVSSALTELGRSGQVLPLDRGWLLTGRPPGELLELGSPPQRLQGATRAGLPGEVR